MHYNGKIYMLMKLIVLVKQKWFLLEMLGDDKDVSVSSSPKPEFDQWRWVSYYYPITQIIDFKREVYRRALLQLATHLPLAS